MSAGTSECVDNRVAGRLAGRLAGKVQGVKQHWAARTVSWMDLVDLCRELDDELLSCDPIPADTLALHAAVLSLAIGSGTWLLHQVEVEAADFSGSGQTLDTLNASLELLKILYRGRHPDFSGGEIESVRRRIFNAAA